MEEFLEKSPSQSPSRGEGVWLEDDPGSLRGRIEESQERRKEGVQEDDRTDM